MSAQDFFIVSVGTVMVLIALLVEVEHKLIWKNYKATYHPHNNQWVDRLLRPNKAVYIINIYILWPLILILGVAILLKNV